VDLIIQTTGDKDEKPNINRFNAEIVTDITTRNSQQKHGNRFNDALLIPKLNNIVYCTAKVTTR